ncbi:MAG: RNA methyltransferase [Bacteroidia bacterium]|nr:RNA methyltransferase [Bacteroidia bacterium]
MINLPEDFKKNILLIYPDEAIDFFEALLNPPVTSVRVNPSKNADMFKDATLVPWCEEGFYLAHRPSFITDPLFHAGAYYVQESSGMFLQYVLKQLPGIDMPLTALDLCAAPGGKSTLMQRVLHPHSALIANEIIKTRVPVLVENMLRWGLPNQIITNNDAKQVGNMSALIDLMLVDAPCSGEGLFRKDQAAIKEWSPENVMLCAGRQQRILREVLAALKPGGFLIYTTCTYNETENDGIVKWLCNDMGLIPFEIDVPELWPIEQIQKYMFKFLPHKVKGEGLFMAVLQKPLAEKLHENKFKEPKLNFVSRKLFPQLTPWLSNPDDFDFVTENDFIYALPKTILPVFAVARSKLYVKHAGICMGKFDKHGELIPEHHLALSICLSKNIESIEVDKNTALLFLKKVTFSLPQVFEQGWYVLRYQGLALGWIKVLPNRINNYLPAGYRIIKELD